MNHYYQFEDVLPKLKVGKKIKRASWGRAWLTFFPLPDSPIESVIIVNHPAVRPFVWHPKLDDILAADWQIIRE
ncbi:MAG TPA: MW1434 family type I TA system toxin [Methylocella sp.]|nr:MW1434 family type I TA system toxin [Methylocella sp.]